MAIPPERIQDDLRQEITCVSKRPLIVALAVLGSIVIACAAAPTSSSLSPTPPSSPPSGASSPSASVTFVGDEASGFRFERPSDWIRWVPNEHNPITAGPLVYLSTQRLLATCAVSPPATPNRPDALGEACSWPLAELEPNGVLVTWYTSRILYPLPTAGEPMTVNGAPTRWQIEQPGECAAIGADETVDVAVPIGQPTPLSNIGVLACLRGPDLASAEGKVKAMLESATLNP